MNDFSIEMQAEKIFDPRTKEYFSEVSSSYYIGNYRAAVVTLWSVVISDMVFKLKFLKEMYEDTIAKDILENIKNEQEKNPISPKWEKDLLDKFKKVNFLDEIEFTHFEFLQKERNFSAHPILNSTSDALYHPNKETVRSLIRSALDGLLIKPPYLNKIFDRLVLDLKEKKADLNSESVLKTYLMNKYFSRMNEIEKTKIFRALWKFVFNLDDDNCKENRNINYRTLDILFNLDKPLFLDLIEKDKEYYNHFTDNNRLLLVKFISKNHEIWESRNEFTEAIIIEKAKSDSGYEFICWFLKEGENPQEKLNKHIEDILEELEKTNSRSTPEKTRLEIADNLLLASKILFEVNVDPDWKNKLIDDLFNEYYGISPQFVDAAHRFKIINQFLPQYTEENLIDLLDKIKSNDQTYWRKTYGGRDVREDHNLIKERCDAINVDYSTYPLSIWG